MDVEVRQGFTLSRRMQSFEFFENCLRLDARGVVNILLHQNLNSAPNVSCHHGRFCTTHFSFLPLYACSRATSCRFKEIIRRCRWGASSQCLMERPTDVPLGLGEAARKTEQPVEKVPHCVNSDGREKLRPAPQRDPTCGAGHPIERAAHVLIHGRRGKLGLKTVLESGSIGLAPDVRVFSTQLASWWWVRGTLGVLLICGPSSRCSCLPFHGSRGARGSGTASSADPISDLGCARCIGPRRGSRAGQRGARSSGRGGTSAGGVGATTGDRKSTRL